MATVQINAFHLMCKEEQGSNFPSPYSIHNTTRRKQYLILRSHFKNS